MGLSPATPATPADQSTNTSAWAPGKMQTSVKEVDRHRSRRIHEAQTIKATMLTKAPSSTTEEKNTTIRQADPEVTPRLKRLTETPKGAKQAPSSPIIPIAQRRRVVTRPRASALLALLSPTSSKTRTKPDRKSLELRGVPHHQLPAAVLQHSQGSDRRPRPRSTTALELETAVLISISITCLHARS